MKNKLIKHFLEAFVIVISILGAFALENWNESRKERQEELKYLASLRLDLLEDLSRLAFLSEFRKNKILASSELLHNPPLSTPEDQIDFFNNLMTVFIWREFTPNKNTIEELVSSGNLSLIKNDSIKDQVQILNKQFEDLATFREHSRREFEQYLYDRLGHYLDLNDYSNIDDLVPGMTISVDALSIETKVKRLKREASALLSDRIVRNGLYLANANNIIMLKSYEDMIPHIKNLINTIEDEIKTE